MKDSEGAGEKRAVVERWNAYYSSGQVIGGYPVAPTVERLFVDSIPDEGMVLELGCGSGRSYSHLMDVLSSWDRPHPFYVGADASSTALQMSWRRRGFNPVLCDIFRLPFVSDSFDIVYSRNAFGGYSFASIRIAASELGRILKSGGFAAVEERGEFDRNSGSSEPTFPDGTAEPLTREIFGEIFNSLNIVTWLEEVRERKTSAGTVTVHSTTAILSKT